MSAPELPGNTHILEVRRGLPSLAKFAHCGFRCTTQCVEIQIPIPFGHVAAKWWGRRDVRPILCMHGWQDNAGSFDTLIPLLPQHVGYLAFDWPGHGRSSRLPPGLLYTAVDDLYILNYIVQQFGWPSVSLLAHSLGAITAYTYAAIYPDLVDVVVALDGLQPRTMRASVAQYLQGALESTRVADAQHQAGTEPPCYTIDEAVAKMNSQSFLSITRASAMCLLARGLAPSATRPDRFYFTRDQRIKNMVIGMYTPEINRGFAESITCPYLYIKALQSPEYMGPEEQAEILEVLFKKPNFHMFSVDGEHHVHLNQPQLVAEAVSEFLCKYEPERRSAGQVVSKL